MLVIQQNLEKYGQAKKQYTPHKLHFAGGINMFDPYIVTPSVVFKYGG